MEDIVEKGRDFPWPKPEHCPNCKGNRLWGHGLVEALFDGYPDRVEVTVRRRVLKPEVIDFITRADQIVVYQLYFLNDAVYYIRKGESGAVFNRPVQ